MPFFFRLFSILLLLLLLGVRSGCSLRFAECPNCTIRIIDAEEKQLKLSDMSQASCIGLLRREHTHTDRIEKRLTISKKIENGK